MTSLGMYFCFLLKFSTDYVVVIDWVLKKTDSETEICMQKFYCGVFLRITHGRE